MRGAPLEAGLAIFLAEVSSGATTCVAPRLGTPLRIPELLGECLLVFPANMIAVATAQEDLETSLWPGPSKLCVYQAWISREIPREMRAEVSKAKPGGHGGCKRVRASSSWLDVGHRAWPPGLGPGTQT